MNKVLAIDLGGTKIAVGIVDANGQVLTKKISPTPLGDVAATKSCILSLASEVLHEVGQADAIGLALPGIVDRRKGILIRSPSSGWRNVPFAEIICNALRLPVFAENDVNACAWGEYHFGAGAGLKYESLFWMTISTGIGGALLVDGKIIEGANSMAGEIGHLIVNPGGALCSCGNCGCLEAEAAGPAWRRIALQFLKSGQSSSLRQIDPETLDAAAVAQAARSHDRLGLLVVEHIATMVSYGIAAVQNILDPQAIIIGGGIAKSLDLLLPVINKKLPDLILASSDRSTEIKGSALGYNAALVGAASLAFFPY
jgi:glucokinase